jgi:hypothetical protein
VVLVDDDLSNRLAYADALGPIDATLEFARAPADVPLVETTALLILGAGSSGVDSLEQISNLRRLGSGAPAVCITARRIRTHERHRAYVLGALAVLDWRHDAVVLGPHTRAFLSLMSTRP